jgi:hypothetical protein
MSIPGARRQLPRSLLPATTQRLRRRRPAAALALAVAARSSHLLAVGPKLTPPLFGEVCTPIFHGIRLL